MIAKSRFLSHPPDTLRAMATSKPAPKAPLSNRDKKVLDFEGSWWLYPGPKDRAIRDYLDISATRYYQVLRRLVDDEEALRYAPLTLRRLRKIQQSRRETLIGRVEDTDGAS
jgi:hypothetical protein